MMQHDPYLTDFMIECANTHARVVSKNLTSLWPTFMAKISSPLYDHPCEECSYNEFIIVQVCRYHICGEPSIVNINFPHWCDAHAQAYDRYQRSLMPADVISTRSMLLRDNFTSLHSRVGTCVICCRVMLVSYEHKRECHHMCVACKLGSSPLETLMLTYYIKLLPDVITHISMFYVKLIM